MITTPTVFILGAGASYPYGYPLGSGLRRHICNPSKGLVVKGKDPYDTRTSDADELRKLFKESTTPSIDQFLNRNPAYGDLGKEIITKIIFEYERGSKFREDIEDGDWYSYLFQIMTETLNSPDGYNDFKKNKVSFITFNYDRSLEYFLYKSLRCSFTKATDKEIYEQFSSIPIHHVYGRLPGLPFEGLSSKLDYGNNGLKNLSQMSISQFSKGIKIMYERDDSDYDAAVDLINNAENIFFLGFGFAEENIQRIRLHEILSGNKIISGTAFGLTKNEMLLNVERLISGIKDGSEKRTLRTRLQAGFHNKDCLNFLREYFWRR